MASANNNFGRWGKEKSRPSKIHIVLCLLNRSTPDRFFFFSFIRSFHSPKSVAQSSSHTDLKRGEKIKEKKSPPPANQTPSAASPTRPRP